jgi:hypothetical protein
LKILLQKSAHKKGLNIIIIIYLTIKSVLNPFAIIQKKLFGKEKKLNNTK